MGAGRLLAMATFCSFKKHKEKQMKAALRDNSTYDHKETYEWGLQSGTSQGHALIVKLIKHPGIYFIVFQLMSFL